MFLKEQKDLTNHPHERQQDWGFLGWHDAEFHHDTLPGDTLRAESTILDKRISKSSLNEGILTVSTSIFNQKNIRVISYVRNLLVYKKNAETPYTPAGY